MSFIVSQKIKGRIYLYQVESYWDKDKKKSRQRRTYIGPKDRVGGGKVKPVLSELSVKHYGNISEISKKQKDIFKNFGMEIPKT